MKRSVLMAGVLGLVLSMTACSSSGTDSPDSSVPAAGGKAAVLGTPDKPVSGKPLKLFVFNQQGASAPASSPEFAQAAQAAVDYVNKNLGGIKGRPLALTSCATLGTPDSVTNCANKAVDGKADVVMKGAEGASAPAVPIITGAGIPYVTEQAGAPAELTSAGSFVLSAGFAAQLAPPIAYAKEKGYKSVGVIYTNVPSLAAALDGTVKSLAKSEGVGYTSVSVSLTTADLTPSYSALLAKGVDAIYVVTTAQQCASALKARAALSDTHPVIISSSCATPTILKSVPATASSGAVIALLDTSAVPTDADTKIYRAAMKKYEPAAEVGSFAPSGFKTVMDFYRVMLTAPDPAKLTPATIKATLSAAKGVRSFMGGNTTLTCDHKAFPKSPAVCSGAAFLVKYDGGNYSLIKAYDSARLLRGIG